MNLKELIDLKLYNDYSNMTVKKDNYYIIDTKTNNLLIYDKKGNIKDTTSLSEKYKLLTYNELEDVFYMHDGSASRKHFVLNSDFEEIRTFTEKGIPFKNRNIKDIFFDKYNLKYLILNDKRAYSVDTDGNYIQSEINVSDFYNIVHNSNNGCCCSNKGVEEAISNFKFTAIGSDGTYKYVAYVENNSTYIAKVSPSGNLIEKMYIADNIEINSIFPNNNYLYAIGNDGHDNYV